MRIPNTAHTSRPWRIHELHELTHDFRLTDVWALPTPGGPDDFPALMKWWASGDPGKELPFAARTLWAIRMKLGKLFGWDDARSGLPTVRDRVPEDLRDTPPGPKFDTLPFTTLYLTDDEWVTEFVNRTVHDITHLGWVPDGTGGYYGEMAIYVKPNGLLGAAYWAAITPFRHLIVYPALMRMIKRDWRALQGDRMPAHAGSGGASSPSAIPSGSAATQMLADRVEVGQRARDRFADADYGDAFRIAADSFHPAEQWARTIFEGGPSGVPGLLVDALLQGLLGMRLGPLDSPDHISGFAIVENEPGTVVLQIDDRLTTSRVVIEASESHATMTTLVRYDRRAARAVWAVVGIAHRKLAAQMLGSAAESLRRKG